MQMVQTFDIGGETAAVFVCNLDLRLCEACFLC